MSRNKLNTNFYLGIGAVVILISVTAYMYNFNNHILSDKPSDWSSFGSYIGGTIAPILTFLTLIILIKQAKVVHDSTVTQVNHLNKSREIENIMNIINKNSKFIKDLGNQIIPTPLDNINLLIGEHSHDGWNHNFENESFLVKFKESGDTVFKWRGAMTYIKAYIDNDIDVNSVLFKPENIELKTIVHNLNYNITKLISSCETLFKSDKNSLFYIFSVLDECKVIVDILNKINYMDKKVYENYIILKSLYNGSINIHKPLSELFFDELLDIGLISKEISDFADFEITQKVDNGKAFFLLKYNNKEFLREDNKWSIK